MAQKLKFGGGKWATKKGSTLAYNDENNNYKPLPFTTTRNSIATRVNKEGLIEVVGNDVPRIDYTDSADGVLLLENSATNLIPYSEDFENSDWTKNAGTTITNNYAISPDGTLNASRYLGTGTSGLGDKFTLSATDNTISFWVKSNNGVNQFCTLLGDSNQRSEDLLVTTEWTRISYTFTASGLSDKTNGIFRDLNDNDIDILIYGAQLEQGSYATSYIPTNGSTATRLADTANGSGNSEVFNDSEGVLFADISAFVGAGGGTRRIEVSNAVAASQYVRLQIANGDGSLYGIVNNGTQQFLFNATSFDATLSNKISLKYKQNDFSLFLNGFEVGSSNVGNTFANGILTQANFSSTLSEFYGKTKELGYYDTALTDLELETLTSYRSLNELVTELNLNTL